MSSAAVVAMATEPPASPPKKLHPLFSFKAGQAQSAAAGEAPTDANWELPGHAEPEPELPPYTEASDATAGLPGVETATTVSVDVQQTDASDLRKRKPVENAAEDTTPTPAPRKRGRPPKKQKPSPGMPDITNHFVRQTPVGGPICTPVETAVLPTAPAVSTTADPSPNTTRRPMRVLQLNPKTGTIGSPPREKGAGRKAATARTSLLVVARYGQEDGEEQTRIGTRIGHVLEGKARIFPEKPGRKQGASPSATGKDAPKKRGRPKKTTHPFFAGSLPTPATATATAEPPNAAASSSSSSKASSSMITSAAAAAKYYASTPCSPWQRTAAQTTALRMPQFGIKNGILRVPGACLPQWPWKHTTHVHPAGEAVIPQQSCEAVLPLRKRKGQTVQISAEESVLAVAMDRLHLSKVADEVRRGGNEDDDFPAPAAGLRVPQKRLLGGRKVQAQVAAELRTNHVAVRNLFEVLPTVLSAFDQHQCETQNWTQKYAPTCAAEVLQSGLEAIVLRDWLAALKVVSVDTGGGEAAAAAAATATTTTTATGAARKKRKKSSKLDGFIVSSDDDDDSGGMATGESLDGEAADWLASGLFGLQRKTVVREAGGARLTNTIILSGPHGCGKTAAVYAAARELGFEVFEINASSRRSGRDVVDRIGDMTRNHMVQHRPKREEEGSGQGDKQARMKSFFQPTSAKRSKMAEATADTSSAAKTPQSQKQSLILLEEADLLYEEDRQFWTTVTGLMAQSKRPFVITCNDETLLPLATLRVHAMLRLGAAPAAEAVDRLLVTAACEGHLLRREAVEALYEARGQDLRGALAELQFWCQLGVGDRRGGFDWFLPRWPEGVDRDEEQQVLRVMSEETYLTGMGWAGVEEDKDERAVDQEELLVQQAWREWQLDMGGWEDSLELGSWTGRWDQAEERQTRERRRVLATCSEFADTMSDADVSSLHVLATGTSVFLDATLPDLGPRAREDFILGRQLVGQPTVAAYGGGGGDPAELRLAATTALRCSAKQRLRTQLAAAGTAEGCRLVEDRLRRVDEVEVVTAIRRARRRNRPGANAGEQLQRIDFALAFDPIATAVSGFGEAAAASHLDPSVFDREMGPIAEDVAPFVREIVAHDGRLQQRRRRLSRFVSDGRGDRRSRGGESNGSNASDEEDGGWVPQPKRMRTTRAALSALEGGPRSAMRRERWFVADINPVLVAKTGGVGWEAAVQAAVVRQAEAAVTRRGMAVDGRVGGTAEVGGTAVAMADAEAVDGMAADAVETAVGVVPADGSVEAAARRRRRKIVMSSPGAEMRAIDKMENI